MLTARNTSTYVKENLLVTMTLQDDMTNPEAQQLCSRLKQYPYIKHVDFISKERVLQEQTKALGTDPSEFVGMNPYQGSIEIRLKGDYANNDSLKWITTELKRYPKVGNITYQKGLIEDVNTFLQKISIVLLVLACLLTFVSFSLINNTVRLSILCAAILHSYDEACWCILGLHSSSVCVASCRDWFDCGIDCSDYFELFCIYALHERT